jgi:hypothetical protein
MVKPLPIINIKAQANHHAAFLIVLGIALFFVVLILAQWYWRQYQLVMIFAYLTTLLTVFTGLVKRLEPRFSFTLSPNKMTYHHRYGQWKLQWLQIKRIAIVKETAGLESLALPYIGLKLNDFEEILGNISPRLANRITHEQKPLISFAIRYNLMKLEQGVIRFEPYKLSSGEQVRGPLAAFLYHSEALHNAFGYHLFIPATSTDRELESFCQLLKSCQLSSANYLKLENSEEINDDESF